MTGHAAPGNTITVAVTNNDHDAARHGTETTAGAGGAFSVTVPTAGGTSILNIVATSPSGGTARAVRTVVCDFAPGTLLFEAADPDGDDNGPGNYAYPIERQLQAGRVRPRARSRSSTPATGSSSASARAT